MSKFKKGDRVIAIEGNLKVKKGMVGIIDEKDSNVPFVLWENYPNIDNKWCINENKIELYQNTNYEVY